MAVSAEVKPRVKRPIRDYSSILTNSVDAASLAMLAETEGHMRYYRSHPERHYEVSRWEPVLRIHMADEVIVRWASMVMGETHVSFDKSVGAWYTKPGALERLSFSLESGVLSEVKRLAWSIAFSRTENTSSLMKDHALIAKRSSLRKRESVA